MYLHITVLVVASAFPLVQILDQQDAKGFDISEAITFNPGRNWRSMKLGIKKGDIHGPILDITAFDAMTSREILMSRIKGTRYKTRLDKNSFINVKDVKQYVKFENHNRTNIHQLASIQDSDNEASDFIGSSSTYPTTECQRIIGYQDTGVTSVTSCAASWPRDQIQQLCLLNKVKSSKQNDYDIDMLPVQTEDGVLYKNRYCAMCNKALNPKYWVIHFICEEPSSILFNSGSASISVLDEYKNSTTCVMEVVPPYDRPLQSCRMRSRRNGPKRSSTINPMNMDIYPVSFSILMNFGFNGKTHIMFSTGEEVTDSSIKDKCQEHEILDPEQDKCRNVSCSDGFSLKQRTCVRDGTAVIYNDTDVAKIENIDMLTNNNRVALISLEVNVTNDDLGFAFFAIEYQPSMVKKIAALLNIASERIQNFTVAFVNQSASSGRNIVVQTMTKEEFENQNAIKDSDGEVDLPLSDDFSESFNFTTTDTNITNESYNFTTNDKNNVNESVTQTDNITTRNATDHKKRALLEETVSNFPKTTTETVEHIYNLSIPFPLVLQLRFILLPSRAQNVNETVAKIIQKMNSLLRTNTFKFDMNGAIFNIVDVDNTVAREKQTFCKYGITDLRYDNEFSVVKIKDKQENTIITNIYVPSTNSFYQPGEYEITVFLEGRLGTNSNVTNVAGYANVCINPRIVKRNCARIRIFHEEYTLFVNKSICFNNEVYNMTQYSVLEEITGKIEICVPDEYYRNKKDRQATHWLAHGCFSAYEKFTKAEGYLTAVVGRFSIVALCSVLITYCLFKSLRNLPGINTMNLTLALLIGETMFIEGEMSSTDWLCSLVAICVHYFFLAAFFWMNVMSYDVYKTFANKCILTRVRKTRKFIPRYALYAWGSPAVIVAICIFVEYGSVFDSFKIGYGRRSSRPIVTGTTVHNMSGHSNNSLLGFQTTNDSALREQRYLGCWIQSPVAAMTAFGAPVLIIFVINMVWFVRTIIRIQATAKLAHFTTRRTFSHMTGRNDVMLYVRMSTVMGFTWIFGLASSILSAIFTPATYTVCLSLHILSILFTIFHCAQGLFIFFAFVFKRRVFYLYRGLFKRIGVVLERRRSKSKKYFATEASASSINSASTTISQISK